MPAVEVVNGKSQCNCCVTLKLKNCKWMKSLWVRWSVHVKKWRTLKKAKNNEQTTRPRETPWLKILKTLGITKQNLGKLFNWIIPTWDFSMEKWGRWTVVRWASGKYMETHGWQKTNFRQWWNSKIFLGVSWTWVIWPNLSLHTVLYHIVHLVDNCIQYTCFDISSSSNRILTTLEREHLHHP